MNLCPGNATSARILLAMSDIRRPAPYRVGRRHGRSYDRGDRRGTMRRPQLTLLAALGLVVALILSACQLITPPRLEVSNDDLSNVLAAHAKVTVKNGGGDRLGWQISSADSRLSFHPKEGMLRSGDSQDVIIAVNNRAVVDGIPFSTTLTIDSSSGTVTVPFRYAGASSAAQCGRLGPRHSRR